MKQCATYVADMRCQRPEGHEGGHGTRQEEPIYAHEIQIGVRRALMDVVCESFPDALYRDLVAGRYATKRWAGSGDDVPPAVETVNMVSREAFILGDAMVAERKRRNQEAG